MRNSINNLSGIEKIMFNVSRTWQVDEFREMVIRIYFRKNWYNFSSRLDMDLLIK
jgi:hypothetical protein